MTGPGGQASGHCTDDHSLSSGRYVLGNECSLLSPKGSRQSPEHLGAAICQMSVHLTIMLSLLIALFFPNVPRYQYLKLHEKHDHHRFTSLPPSI